MALSLRLPIKMKRAFFILGFVLATLTSYSVDKPIDSRDDTVVFENHAVTLTRWNGEVSLRLEYSGEGHFVSYRMPPNKVEIGIRLDHRPSSNIFDFTLSGCKECVFLPQSALTKKEINEGWKRPVNVIDSIAIYHKWKRDHEIGKTNYATGKLWHIYRIEAFDSAEQSVYGKMEVRDGHLLVTVPQFFLDSASYPVFVDPTLGYTTVGSSVGNLGVYTLGNFFLSSANGTITDYQIYLEAANSPPTEDYTVAVYDASGCPGSCTASGQSQIGISAGTTYTGNGMAAWKVISMSGSIVSGNYYWLPFSSDDGNNTFEYADSGTVSPSVGRAYILRLYSSGSMPNPMSTVTTDSFNTFSAYIDYTTGGGGGGPCMLSLLGVGKC